MVGELESVEQVAYGPSHPTQAGKLVPGFFRASVRIGAGAWSEQVTFNQFDKETDAQTAIYEALTDPSLVGRRVALKVAADGNGKYVNFRAVRLLDIPPAPAVGAES